LFGAALVLYAQPLTQFTPAHNSQSAWRTQREQRSPQGLGVFPRAPMKKAMCSSSGHRRVLGAIAHVLARHALAKSLFSCGASRSPLPDQECFRRSTYAAGRSEAGRFAQAKRVAPGGLERPRCNNQRASGSRERSHRSSLLAQNLRRRRDAPARRRAPEGPALVIGNREAAPRAPTFLRTAPVLRA